MMTMSTMIMMMRMMILLNTMITEVTMPMKNTILNYIILKQNVTKKIK